MYTIEMRLTQLVFIIILSSCGSAGGAFSVTARFRRRVGPPLWFSTSAADAGGNTDDHFSTTKDPMVDLSGDGGVLGEGLPDDLNLEEIAPLSLPITIAYRGTIAPSDWTASEVVKCWLHEQQGLGELAADAFLEKDIAEAQLTNPDFFTEEFVVRTFPSLSKIQVKKLLMASRRLATSRTELAVGTTFDAQDSYPITKDKKLISGMSRGIALLDETTCRKLTIVCRCDYAYGAEGYRKPTGEVVVPPYATLQFDMELLS